MTKFSEVPAAGITIRESANDGSDFTNPAADYRRLFLGEDGQLHVKDSAGTVSDIGSGTGIAATLLDAKGDMIAASAADTAAKVTVGANGTVLEAASGATAGVQWDYPPGYEFNRVEITSQVVISATTEGTATTIITGGAVTYDGSTAVDIEFFAPRLESVPAAAARPVIFVVLEDSTVLGRIAVVQSVYVSGHGLMFPVIGRIRRTPSNASHTYYVKAYKSNASDTASVDAGAGGTGAQVPAYLRVVKA